MSHRAWWLVIATIVLLGIAVAVQEGLRRNLHDAPLPDSPSAAAADTSAASATAAAATASVELRAAHDAAMQDAVSAVHAYLAALFKDDRARPTRCGSMAALRRREKRICAHSST
jgi:hypothetical protein